MSLPPIASENIIKILGIESLPDEQKIKIVEKIGDLVQKRLTLRLMESLSEEEGRDFEALLEKNDTQGVGAFMDKRLPNLADWVAEEVVKIKQELAGSVEDLLKA